MWRFRTNEGTFARCGPAAEETPGVGGRPIPTMQREWKSLTVNGKQYWGRSSVWAVFLEMLNRSLSSLTL